MTLGDKQRLFTRLLPVLLNYLHQQGYECTLGDAYRDPRVFGVAGARAGYGHPRSAHKQRLAIDLNLFKDGVYLTGSEAHRPIGEFWESLHNACRWGGRFADGNHYSLEHDGMM